MKKEKHSKQETNDTAVEQAAEQGAGEGVKTENSIGSEQEIVNEVDELKSKLEGITKQSEENFGKFVRMQADFDNFRKRIAREKEELYYASLEKIVMEILPIVDNMERAIAAFKSDNLDNKYVEGIDMVQKQLIDVLKKNGLKEIEAENMTFDPNYHHAVMQVEGNKDEENKIMEVLQKGYLLGSKVIRPSLVKVAVLS